MIEEDADSLIHAHYSGMMMFYFRSAMPSLQATTDEIHGRRRKKKHGRDYNLQIFANQKQGQCRAFLGLAQFCRNGTEKMLLKPRHLG